MGSNPSLSSVESFTLNPEANKEYYGVQRELGVKKAMSKRLEFGLKKELNTVQ